MQLAGRLREDSIQRDAAAILATLPDKDRESGSRGESMATQKESA